MEKARDAFRTISEVASWLETPAHVLRFWESKFNQVKPVKRAGGRRYYRPSDMQLLGGIKKLLHEDGMTIKGVQKILREEGVKKVAAAFATASPRRCRGTGARRKDRPLQRTSDRVDRRRDRNTCRAHPGRRWRCGSRNSRNAPTRTGQYGQEPVLADAAAQKSTIPKDLPSETEAPASETAALEGAEAGLPDRMKARLQMQHRGQGHGCRCRTPKRIPADEDIDAPPPVAARIRALHPGHLAARRDRIAPLYERLKSLRGRMGG